MAETNKSIEIINKISEYLSAAHQALQDPFLDSLAYAAETNLRGKTRRLHEKLTGVVFLGAHLKNAAALNSTSKYVNLAEDFLGLDGVQYPDGSIFLLTNNDIGKHLPQYLELYANNRNSLFVVWDWDSQHWLQMSGILAVSCDYYVSASSENTFILSHFNPCIIGPVFVGAHQWSRRFILENIPSLLGARQDTPLGPHGFYEKYARRNRAIAAVGRHFESVGFASNDYKGRSDLDNLKQWAAHKSHWIVPVLGGVPIRVYNALITGGIPIVPAFYKNLPEIHALGDVPVFYETSDLVDPAAVNAAAVAKFDQQGESGLLARIAHAVEYHHVDAHCERILCAVQRSAARMVGGNTFDGDGYLGFGSKLD
jgi:hypothetical protein